MSSNTLFTPAPSPQPFDIRTPTMQEKQGDFVLPVEEAPLLSHNNYSNGQPRTNCTRGLFCKRCKSRLGSFALPASYVHSLNNDTHM